MMFLLDSFQGNITVRVTTAAPENFLMALNEAGICLRNVQHHDVLTITVELARKDYKSLCTLAKKSGSKIEIVAKRGAYWSIVRLISRPVLLLGLTILLVLTLLLPNRVLFVEVEGNETLPAALILEKAELCGICFGASRRTVRGEATKNRLLSLLPELRWAGVNTSGCVAVISVQEKKVTESKSDRKSIGHVVAAKDAIIAEMTVLRGNGLCKTGQAVRKGQILVSGYTDHGIMLEGACADAEISGYTGNILYMITPVNRCVREDVTSVKTKYSLLVGKKLINFSKDSGISDAECVRMYEESYLTLPGGFRLPLCLIRERIVSYSVTAQDVEITDACTWLETAAEEYLRSQMISGEILRSNTMTANGDGVCVLYGTYQCRELIGRIYSEEIMITDEQRG